MDQFVKEQDTDTVAVEYNFHTIPYTMNFGTVDSCPVDDAETFELAKPRWYQTLETRDSQEGNMAITRAYIPVGGRSLILITMMPLPPTEGISTLADPLMVRISLYTGVQRMLTVYLCRRFLICGRRKEQRGKTSVQKSCHESHKLFHIARI